jgi:hypothetical protein
MIGFDGKPAGLPSSPPSRTITQSPLSSRRGRLLFSTAARDGGMRVGNVPSADLVIGPNVSGALPRDTRRRRQGYREGEIL